VGAHYLVGPGYLANIYEEKCDMTAIDLNLPNNSEFTKNTQDGSKTLQWKNYATEKNYKDFNLVITDVLGGQDVKQSSGNNAFYNPYGDGSADGVNAYDKTLVKAFVENEETGAGATLDYDLLDTRGNAAQLDPTAIKNVNANLNGNSLSHRDGWGESYNIAGQRVSNGYKGLVISGNKKFIK
jgi:hypothetical protein